MHGCQNHNRMNRQASRNGQWTGDAARRRTRATKTRRRQAGDGAACAIPTRTGARARCAMRSRVLALGGDERMEEGVTKTVGGRRNRREERFWRRRFGGESPIAAGTPTVGLHTALRSRMCRCASASWLLPEHPRKHKHRLIVRLSTCASLPRH